MAEGTFERVLAKAAEQHGFITTADARAIGVRPEYLRRLAGQRRTENRGRGLYRVVGLPMTERTPYEEAVLWANGKAAIAGEAALALWELADVNPRLIDIILPPGYQLRRQQGPKVRIRRQRLEDTDVDFVDDIPVLTAAKAIEDTIRVGVDKNLVDQAIRNAAGRNLIGELAAARLRVALEDRAGVAA